jgi:cytochrome c oxidase assembly protein subunit 15
MRGNTLAIFVLGGLQGVMGWYMVKSGSVDDPRVSQFRLTAHLGLAIAIFWAMFWVALSLVAPRRASPAQPALRKWANGIVVLIFVMILSAASSRASAPDSRTTRSR